MQNRVAKYWKLHRVPILLVLVSCIFYGVFAHNLVREDFPKLLSLFAALFFLHYKLIQFKKWNFRFLLVAGMLFRLVFLMVEPNLSQDFYRFIWDGELIKNGLNPYRYTPNELIEQTTFHIQNAKELHQGMGTLSARHYSNYPPMNQLFFYLSTLLGMGSIMGSLIWLRIFIIAADIGVLYFGRKLLGNLNLSPHLLFWYFLNPLVIIELTGNLHFEGMMLFLFIWAMYLISAGNSILAAPIYAASIMLKLVPLLFLPLFLKFFGIRKSALFYLVVGVSSFIYLIPFYTPELAANYSKTIGLWFSNFEFNASIYNLVKYLGVEFFGSKPWELIKSYGSFVKVGTLIIILLLTFVQKHQTLTSVLKSMFFVLVSYYFLSSTVHPWYIVFPLVLGLFTDYRFAILWSAVIILSYFTYSQPEFKENLWLIALEYFLVIGYFVYEFVKNRNIPQLIRKNL